MKRIKLSAFLLLLIIFCQNSILQAQENSIKPFLGSWALTLDYESSSAGWLDVRQEDGYLDADVLWRWGSVFPADFVFMMDNQFRLC